jgi:hypothetical protein
MAAGSVREPNHDCCHRFVVLQDIPCVPGRPIKKQQQIRLQHGATRKWLHSHQFYSPMSGNQEVRRQSLTHNPAVAPRGLFCLVHVKGAKEKLKDV